MKPTGFVNQFFQKSREENSHLIGTLRVNKEHSPPCFLRLAYCYCCQVTSVVSDSVWPHRRQPTSLPCPWDSPGKNTGVGCHFHLQCMKVKTEKEVDQSCRTLSNPTDCGLPGSSVQGSSQARVLEWGAIPSPWSTGALKTHTHRANCEAMRMLGNRSMMSMGVKSSQCRPEIHKNCICQWLLSEARVLNSAWHLIAGRCGNSGSCAGCTLLITGETWSNQATLHFSFVFFSVPLAICV